MKVFFDMDGVLYSWNKGIATLFGVDYNDKDLQRKFSGDSYGLENFIGTKKVSEGIQKAGSDFWLNLELLPWAKETYYMMENAVGKKNIYFATSFGRWPDAVDAKIKAIKRDFDQDNNKIILLKDKFLLAKPSTILIDDKEINIIKFIENGGLGALFPNEFRILSGKMDEASFSKYLLDLKRLISVVKMKEERDAGYIF